MGDNVPVIPGLLLVAALLALNAIFVAAEFAYVTVRRTQMQHLENEGNARAGTVLNALKNLDFYVAASQLGITMASVALGFLGEPVIAGLIEPPIVSVVGSFAPAIAHTVAIAIAFLFVTALHIVLGEFVPKSIALQRPDSTSLWLAIPMEVFVFIFRPAIWLLNSTGNGLLRLLGMSMRPIGDELLRAEDLAWTLESSASAGLISRRELDLSRNTLRLATLSVRDLMTPRSESAGIPVDATLDDIVRTFAAHRFTRYPVYRESLDDIVGVLDAKQSVFALATEPGDWRAHIGPAVLLPDSTTVERALSELRTDGNSLAVLVDEYGGTAGILTLFDIIDFLAHDLPDEFEEPRDSVRFGPHDSVTVSGLTHLVELERDLEIELPEVTSRTLGGMIMDLLGRVPEVGDTVVVDRYTARVESMDNMRVDLVTFTPRHDDDADADGDAHER
ncbi:MAG TPA: hemolysin family protein [Thermomicrobiales bacterium]|nr:hemolysin family protein [Thermomicrobiales bacterium]